MRGLVPRIQAKKKHWIAGTSLDKPGDDEGEVVRYDRNALLIAELGNTRVRRDPVMRATRS